MIPGESSSPQEPDPGAGRHRRPWFGPWFGPWREGLTTPAGRVALFVVAPLLASVVLGWNRVDFGSQLSRVASTLYWTGLVYAVWAAATFGTLLVHVASRHRRWPQWLLALAGAVVGLVVFYWPIARYRHFGLSLLPPGARGAGPPLPWPALDYLPQLIANTLPGILYWTVTVWIVSRTLAAPSRELLPGATSAPGGLSVEAVLRARLPAHLDGEILALKAEDHYVRVYTAKGDTLVHHRFRDAVHDLAGIDGLQVHRSFWVRRSAITRRYSEGHGHFLCLQNDLRVPVSRSYLNALRTGESTVSTESG